MKSLTTLWMLVIVLAVGAGQASGQYPWTKDTRNPVLSGGAIGSWNRHLFAPCVLFNTDSSRYEMWFGASSGTTSDWRPYRVGFATSKDGISWTMYPSAVLSPTPGTWDAYTVEIPMVIRENGGYKMWYSGSATGVSSLHIGYATSHDGINWTKYSGNPLLGPGKATWEDESVYSCAVMSFPGGYQMWYGGSDSSVSEVSIGYATSSDGIIWQRDTANNPVLKPGASGQWDALGGNVPRVLHKGGTYYLWYEGWGTISASQRSIGAATSKDTGRTWTKYANNPALSPSPGTWDATDAEPGSVLLRGDTLDMWYDGGDNSFVYRIGHATSPIVTGIAERDGEVPQHFMLSQNYPNPFNPSTTIKYELAKSSHVSLIVYDILGRQASVLVNERREAGVHEVKFDGSNLASGVYFCRLQAGDFVQSKKLLLLK